MKTMIVAAGQEKSAHSILGKMMVQYVIEAAYLAGLEDISIVLDAEDKAVETELSEVYPTLNFVAQSDFDKVDEAGALVLYGNMPLITAEAIKGIMGNYNNRKNFFEMMGPCVHTQVDLAEAAARIRERINNKHMLNGVRMMAPETVYIDDAVDIAPGVVIYPNVILESRCKIGPDVTIGANSHLKNTVVEAGVNILQSVIFDATIGAGTEVGPFAYLRQNANIGEKCRIGNFVEIKNSNLDSGVKAAHLAYIGDADLGKNVNYSCGAITANYDGKFKHRTKVGDNAFIGSNATLIAPVTVGDDALVAAGSTITDNLQSHSLGIARARQVEKLGWVKSKP